MIERERERVCVSLCVERERKCVMHRDNNRVCGCLVVCTRRENARAQERKSFCQYLWDVSQSQLVLVTQVPAELLSGLGSGLVLMV